MGDEELKELAKMELSELEDRIPVMEDELKVLLLPKDPNDEKNVILEVRAGTGGEEAALFAQDLLRMYLRYAERRGWNFVNNFSIVSVFHLLTAALAMDNC